ncbi:MAG: response regulator [Anaerolineae bacterium]|nr:response regulator [Anaerolineae bacterium]MDW8173267.1 response regulator [Anaerolineae bacterium]
MAEKILIVDDDIDSLKLIGLMLQRHGYEVSAANSGSQALVKAEKEQPNLIILDVMMPDMNGLEVCRRLRTNERTSDIAIIMFTAKTLIDDKVKGFEAGADDYLTKPTHPAELASRVKAILARRAAKQETAPPLPSDNLKTRGLTIGVVGAKGGVGTTTVAINIAAAAVNAGDNPVLADFRLGQGSIGVALGMIRTQSMSKLMALPTAELNAQVVENAISTHQSGLRLIASSINPRDMLAAPNLENALTIVRQLRAISKLAVFDLGSGFNPYVAKLHNEMDKLVVVVEPNAVALSIARELVKFLDEEGSGGKINIAVLNRAQSSLQTSWHDAEAIVGRELKAIISPAPELAFQAIESKVPIVLLQPSSIVAGQMVKLAEELRARVRPLAGGQLTT